MGNMKNKQGCIPQILVKEGLGYVKASILVKSHKNE